MAQSSGPYNSELVNELHRLFPALLYDNEGFTSISDVFDYVNRQMRRNYDVYSSNRYEYLQQHLPQYPPHTPNRRPRNNTSPPPLPRRQRVVRPQEAPPAGQQQQQQQQQQYEEDLSQSEGVLTPILANWLNSLLTPPVQAQAWTYNIPLTGGAGAIAGWGGEEPLNSFLEPIPVPPSPEILRNNTTVYVIAETPADTVCTVCQDSMEQGATVRKLTTCGHTFHRTCVDTWFQRNVHCPTCRHDVRNTAVVLTGAA